MDVLEWLAKSSDLIIIVNVWEYLVRRVHVSGRQLNNVSDLQDTIMDAWSSLDLNHIQSLYRCIPTRLLNVVKKKGKMIPY